MVLLELRRARITSRVAHLLTPTYFLLSFQYHTIVFELFCFPHASLVFPYNFNIRDIFCRKIW